MAVSIKAKSESAIELTSEKQARRVCAKFCAAAGRGLPRLRTIAAVGALDAEIGADTRDSKRLTAIMAYLLRSGFLIDPDFKIDPVNFHQGRDFLKEVNKVDLIFISFILDRHQKDKTFVYDPGLKERAKMKGRDVLGVALSALHERESWRRRIFKAKAGMVVTYGGLGEIGTHTLCNVRDPQSLVPLIKTPREPVWDYRIQRIDGYDFDTKPKLATLYNNAANDLPMPWLAFAGDKRYLAAALPGVSGDTALGRRVMGLDI